jgi:hypothetical protein
MQPVVLQRTDVAGANADGAASPMKRKLHPAKDFRPFRPRSFIQRKVRGLDESGPDELLDDWMVSCPTAEPLSSE